MSQSRLLDRAFRHFRSQRMALFEKYLQPSNTTRILDVGGSPLIWEFSNVRPRLTILNFPSALSPASPNLAQVGGDGRFLPFCDQSFDIVFSNSVIEHVGTRDDQRRFAEEVQRVGRRYWIQTPNRLFPVELHVMLPLIHYLPASIKRAILSRFTLWERLTHPTEAERASYIHHVLTELNLLDARQLRTLFPGASTIVSERFLGVTKSIVALKC